MRRADMIRFGPVRRCAHPGVPADRMPKGGGVIGFRAMSSTSFLRGWRSTTSEQREEHRRSLVAAAAAVLGLSAAALPDRPSPGRFRALVATENEETSDGRIVDENALTWRTPPLPLMFQRVSDIGHFGSYLVGWFDTFERDGLQIWGEGFFDGGDDAVEAARVIRDAGRMGISMDVAPIDEEIEITEVDEDGWPIDGLYHLVKGEILGATATPFPAIASAHIVFVEVAADAGAGEEAEPESEAAPESEPAAASAPALAAAAAPVRPPGAWFDDPSFAVGDGRLVEQPDGGYACPLTITADGRVFGHAARWGQCHVGYDGLCVDPPHSPSGYAWFRRGCTETEDGTLVATGVLSIGAGHAGRRLSAAEAMSHYDNTTTGAADVAMGEDEFGIWFAGALRPTATDEQIRELRGSCVSGDWRGIAGEYDFIALLAVNVPGYPIARVASGLPVSLLSAGVVVRDAEQHAAEVRSLRRDVERLRRVADANAPATIAAAAARIAR